jgi:hypothetical protein
MRRWCAASTALLLACSQQASTPTDGGLDASPGGSEERPTAPLPCSASCQLLGPHLCIESIDGVCVECGSDGHCAGNPDALGPRCDAVNRICVCEGDDDCVGNPGGPRCDPVRRLCGCATDGDCAAPRGCQETSFDELYSAKVCRAPCGSDADCRSPEKPRCDPETGACHGCLVDEDCAAHASGARCVGRRCGCQGDDDCQGAGTRGGVCFAETARCGCRSDAGCAGKDRGPRCSPETDACSCVEDAECHGALRCALPTATARRPICLPPCASDGDCAARAGLPRCAAKSKKCVACGSDADCDAAGPAHCSQSLGVCVGCADDGECAGSGERYCNPNLGLCATCRTDADCAGTTTPACDTGAGECVACVARRHCAASLAGGACLLGACGCANDEDCLSSRAWGRSCLPTGRCGCVADNDCAGSDNGPHCLASASRCTCHDSSECKSAPHTICALPYASAAYTHCQAPCAAGRACKASPAPASCCRHRPGLPTCDLSSGRCVACMDDGDCGGAYPHCGPLGQCLECETGAHCAANLHRRSCDPRRGCVECLSDADCGAGSLGATCREGACTCQGDADCAGHASGERCDGLRRVCSCASDADCPAPGTSCSAKYLGIMLCR